MSAIQNGSMNPVLYPQVGSVGAGQTTSSPKASPVDTKKGEFDDLLKKVQIEQPKTGSGLSSLTAQPELNQIKTPLKFSQHASQRLQERKIVLDASTMARVNDAVDRAAAKGVEDTLVLTDRAALIVNTKNRTVVTAMDRTNLAGNIFTNIDGAVMV